MDKKLVPGVRVVAKGKLAIVDHYFSRKNIRVTLCSTRESLLISARDIEIVDDEEESKSIDVNDVNDVGQEDLAAAVVRHEQIGLWLSGEQSVGQAARALGISVSYIFKLARSYSEELGPVHWFKPSGEEKRSYPVKRGCRGNNFQSD